MNENRYFLLTVAFFSGMAIMGIELSAARLIAPFYGTSTFVWTNVIGVVMIALSLGYYFGGKLADQTPRPEVLYKFLLAASLISLTLPFITPFVAGVINDLVLLLGNPAVAIFVGSLLLMIVLFFIPMFIMAFTSPFIIKLLSQQDSHVGENAGQVFAISTIGSIIGTFTPILIFIPIFGTRKSIILFSLSLLIISIIGLYRRKVSLLLVLLVIPALLITLPPIRAQAGLVAEVESVYQYIQIVDQGDLRHIFINEGNTIYSSKNMNGILTGLYYDYYLTLPHLIDKTSQDILLLGLAAGTISSQIIDYHADNYDIRIDGVEIDKKIIDIGYEYFDMARDNLEVIYQDGRVFIDQTDRKYDHIIIDTYSNQLYISFQLTTREFFNNVAQRLNSGGIVSFNVNAISRDSRLLNAITNTMNLEFEHVYLLKTGNSLNYMVLASQQPIDFDRLKTVSDPGIQEYLGHMAGNTQIHQYRSEYDILTDDKAPIEYLTDYMILEYLAK